MEVIEVKNIVDKVKTNVQKVMVGKEETIDYMMVSILCSGNVLLEDVPGLGKTLLARALSKSINTSFSRIQFTPDLLPSDITGINYYNQKTNQFQFKKGPLMNQLILADEINRATPRTQSSLLESMEEHQVTVDGITYKLDEPFFVIATQNPIENAGTYPLPEAQLDRFFMKINMGYPNFDEEYVILTRFETNNPLDEIESVVDSKDIIKARKLFNHVKISDDLIKYILKIVHKTREHQDIRLGISPRGAQALFKGSQAYAAIQGRDFVTPDDIKNIIKPIFRHRLVIKGKSKFITNNNDLIIDQIVESVEVPSEQIKG